MTELKRAILHVWRMLASVLLLYEARFCSLAVALSRETKWRQGSSSDVECRRGWSRAYSPAFSFKSSMLAGRSQRTAAIRHGNQPRERENVLDIVSACLELP